MLMSTISLSINGQLARPLLPFFSSLLAPSRLDVKPNMFPILASPLSCQALRVDCCVVFESLLTYLRPGKAYFSRFSTLAKGLFARMAEVVAGLTTKTFVAFGYLSLRRPPRNFICSKFATFPSNSCLARPSSLIIVRATTLAVACSRCSLKTL